MKTMALPDRHRIKGFDGVRGLSATAVVAHHTAFTFSYIGEVAVYLFFVLSGFLIMGILQRNRSAMERGDSTFRDALIGFWKGRALRIFPVYYLALGTMLLLGWLVASAYPLRGEVVWYLAYLQNYQIGFQAKDWGIFSHTWTLAVEQQFYMLFGVVFLAVTLKHHRRTIAIAMAISLFGYLWSVWLGLSSILIYTLPGLGFCFILAGCFARTVPLDTGGGRPSKITQEVMVLVLGLGIAGLSLLPAAKSGLWSAYLPIPAFLVKIAFVAVCAMFLWALASYQETWLVRMLEWRPVRWIGQLSYALYIVHFPVAALGAWFIERHVGLSDYAATANFFLTMAISLGLAAFSWRFIESPAARFKRKSSPSLPVVQPVRGVGEPGQRRKAVLARSSQWPVGVRD